MPSLRWLLHLASAALLTPTLAAPAAATLVLHFDPNEIGTLFQNGGAFGGTVPVTGIGDNVGWITDARSPTPGGAALDGFIDAQQGSTAGGALANSLGGTVLDFAGSSLGLLGFDDENIGNIDELNGAMDTSFATLILAGQAASVGSGLDFFVQSAFGLEYDHTAAVLRGRISGTALAATALSTDEWFVSTLTWDGTTGTASLKVTTAGGTTTTVGTSAALPIDHERFRIGRDLHGLVGDVYLYNDVDDHGAIHAQLVAAYIPEPSTAVLLGIGLVGLSARRRGRARG